MKRLKKLAIALAMTFCISSPYYVLAENSVANEFNITQPYMTGLKFSTDEEIEAFLASFPEEEKIPLEKLRSLPSSVDISQSPYFPDQIGNQESVGSCTSWATTYYQFTYEVNRLNNVPWTGNSTTASPRWTYSLNCNGANIATSIPGNYFALRNQGAVNFEDFPDADGEDFYRIWYDDVEVMTDALSTRITNVDSFDVTDIGNTPVSSPSSSALTDIKNALANGKPLLMATQSINGLSNWNIITQNGVKYAFRCTQASNGHAMLIVGYDDNITLDINENGSIESGERGAFKVVNSWGDSWGNSGFIWLMYDAMNPVTSVSGDWESDYYYTNRINAFNEDLFYIDVNNLAVNLVGKLTFNTTYRNQLSLCVSRSLTTVYDSIHSKSLLLYNSSRQSNPSSYNGSIVFDYTSQHLVNDCTTPNTPSTNLANPISSFYTGYYWFIRVRDTRTDSHALENVSFEIMDNKQNTVKNFGQITSSIDGTVVTESRQINLLKGDVNYDSQLTQAEVNIVSSIAIHNYSESNLQFFLADMNGDGNVNVQDVSILAKTIL